MNSLVLGGNGYLGRELVKQLVSIGDSVISVDKFMPELKQAGVSYIICDISIQSQIVELLEHSHVDRIFHFAGIAEIGDANESFCNTIHTNTLGTLFLLDAMGKKKIRNLIFASSMYVFSKKGGVYRLSKQISEQLISEYSTIFNLNATILRFGSIYGPGSNESNGLHQIVKSALTGPKIRYEGNQNSVREYIHLNDAVKACVAIANSNLKGCNFHLITGEKILKISDVLLMIKEMIGKDIEIEFGESSEDGHYIITPYSFHPEKGEKYRSLDFIDFSYGLWELIHYVSELSMKDSARDGSK